MAGLPPRPAFTPDRRSSPPLRRRDDRTYSERDDYRRDRDRDYDRGRRTPPRWDDRDRDRDRRGPPPSGYRDLSRERGRLRGPPPRSPPRSPPRPPYDRDRDRYPPGNRYRSPPRHRLSPNPPPYRGRRFSRSRSPLRSPRRFTPSPPPRRHARPVSPMRGPGPSRFRSRSPKYPPPKRIKLGSHSIGSPPPVPPSTRSPERIRYRSQSRDSRYRHSRAPSRDQRRNSPGLPTERRPLRDPDSPRDEGEIREYDTPDRDKLLSQNQRAPSLSREPPSTLPVPEESKTSVLGAKAVTPPTPAKNIVENDVKPHVLPAADPASTALPPSSLPPVPQVLPQQSIRSTSPPKHPRNWSESRPTESSLFIPPSIRRGRGRGSGGSYRGGTYRGGGPPDAPRAPRNRGPSQQSTGPDNSEETTVAPSGVNVPSPADTSNSKAATPPIHPSVEPEESIEQLLKWVNEELIVTDIIQEERRIVDRSKVLRDEYLAAHQYTHQLMMDHYKITNEAHRALHEYEMANQELRHLQLRRQVLNKQQELARLGLLGMDYEPDGNSISTPGR
ncbi:hypothetical protein HHX47_DHR1000640 [Lentinula edodes]|nr:hypothetical protein HHX47_DHR1000640 [Lentinula edodes]KAJ3923276.1 hypothetical protein F5877DRAFT_74444 [Lentinula edodes]